MNLTSNIVRITSIISEFNLLVGLLMILHVMLYVDDIYKLTKKPIIHIYLTSKDLVFQYRNVTTIEQNTGQNWI